MKKRFALLVSGSMLFSGAFVTFVSAARQDDVDVSGAINVRVDIDNNKKGSGEEGRNDDMVKAEGRMNANATTSDDRDDRSDDDSVRGDDHRSATGTAMSDKEREDKDEDHATTSRGEMMSGEHRSSVAVFVQSLLNVADREQGGIGEEVRAVAEAQHDAASTSVEAMTKVEKRSPIMIFLFGSDYKSLGHIRSEIVTTDNGIARLQNVLNRTTDMAVKAELQSQISAMETSRAELDAYITAHENVFSLFGWAFRLLGGDR